MHVLTDTLSVVIQAGLLLRLHLNDALVEVLVSHLGGVWSTHEEASRSVEEDNKSPQLRASTFPWCAYRTRVLYDTERHKAAMSDEWPTQVGLALALPLAH